MGERAHQYPVSGAGLGLRRPLIKQLMDDPPADVDFMEVAPENWINVGGRQGKNFRYFTERYPVLIHGLSLSIGSPAPLDEQLVRDIKKFMADHDIREMAAESCYEGPVNVFGHDLDPEEYFETMWVLSWFFENNALMINSRVKDDEGASSFVVQGIIMHLCSFCCG